MFRGGGKVSSYGNGIASGLGYAGGGQIGGGAVYGQLMPDGRYGFQKPFIPIGQTKSQIDAGRQAINQMYGIADDFADVGSKSNVKTQGGNILKRGFAKTKSGLGSLKTSGVLQNPVKFGTDAAIKYGAKGFGIPTAAKYLSNLKLPGSSLFAAVSGPGIIAEANRPKTYAALQYMKDMNQSGVFDETAGPGDYEAFTLEFDKLNDPSKYTPIPDDRGFFNKYLNPMGAIVGLGDKSKEEIGLIVDEDNKKIEEAETKEAAETGKEVNVDIETGNVTEPVLSKKERLEQKAKEYEEILGAGIKKDSIFDAMVEGGTRLMEGEGFAGSLRAANKALDPIQNIRTASRKLALEEDIALRKAIAVGAAKDTDMSRRIAALKAGGYTPEQIADAVAGTGRPKSKADYIKDTNSATTGLTLWVKDNVPDLKSLLDKKAIKDPKVTASLEDGKHYIPELFTLITIKEGVVVDKEKLK
jgi:hypothetical protein